MNYYTILVDNLFIICIVSYYILCAHIRFSQVDSSSHKFIFYCVEIAVAYATYDSWMPIVIQTTAEFTSKSVQVICLCRMIIIFWVVWQFTKKISIIR